MRLLVAGMHRSGTSAVGRLLSELGVATAAPDDLLGADDHNRLGHYEISDLTELNDELLAAIGAHWAAPPTAAAFDAQIELAGGPLGRRAGELVDAKLPPDDWFWKDPRLSVLLPFWREILPEEPAVIWVHRHPAAVARSLQKRNRFGLDIGAALWERYTQLLRAGSAGLATHIVGFDGLIETPDITASALEAFVVDVGLDIAPRESRDAVVAGERHHSDVVIDLTPAQEELLAEISAHIDRRVPLEWASADARPEPTVPISASAPLVIAADDEVERLSVELAESRRDSQAQLDRLHAELEEARRLAQTDLDRVNTELEETRESARADLDRVNTELEEARRLAQTDLDRVNTELEEVRRLAQSALDQGARERLEAGAAIDRLQVALGLSEGELRQTEERLSLTTTELAHLTALYDAEVGSNTHQVIAAYRRAVGRALPSESRRREAYIGAVGGVRRLVHRARPDASAQDPVPSLVPPTPPGVVLELSNEPEVSLIIPVHGNVDITRRLLESIAAHTTDVAYETIIVDDESPDEMPDFLDTCRGIRIVTNVANQGYLRSTNAGAAIASAPVIVLLNNDTEVTPGWVEALLEVLADESVGAVGARLVYPDRRLQEAGSIIWSDGTGWNYGKFGSPDRFDVMYRRDVDYCSAACLAVRREVWNDIGGFDERYVPAYYEDADLCFEVRARGLRVVYQPDALVVHHEGVSHGTDLTSGMKAHQESNRHTFAAKWATELESHHTPDPAAVRRAADRASGRCILVVDHQVPAPDRDAGSLRMFLLLRAMLDLGHRVRFFPANRFANPPYHHALQSLGIEVVYGDVDPVGYLDEIVGDVDAAILSRPLVAVNWLPILRDRLPDVPIAYDMVDFHGLREQRRSSTTGDDLADRQSSFYTDLELTLVNSADITIAVSDVERDLVRSQAPEAVVTTIPTVHQHRSSDAPFTARRGLLFVGSWAHPPNRDAISWFVDDVLPLVRAELGDIVTHIVGSDVPADVAAGSDDVVVHGWVEDLDPIFDQVRVSVAPMRYGAGMKGKVGDSLARGVPVVATTIAGEGYELDGFQLDLADDAADFAAAVVGLYTDEQRWTRTAKAGHEAVIDELGTTAVTARLESTLALLGLDVLPARTRSVDP